MEIRDGCRDFELMIDAYSVSDSSLGREQVDVKAKNLVHLIDQGVPNDLLDGLWTFGRNKYFKRRHHEQNCDTDYAD